MWTYVARVDRVVDGDTVDLLVDLGFGTFRHERFRLFGVDTPEVYGSRKSEAGKRASEYVKSLLPEGSRVRVQTLKGKGKFGRYLAVLWCDPLGEESLNDNLVREGHALVYDGGKRG